MEFLARGLLGPARLVANADVEISSVPLGDQPAPVITNRSGRPDCTWVASLRNVYGRYARAEIGLVQTNRWLRPWYHAASHVTEALLVSGGLAGGNFLNNWLLATNLHRRAFNVTDIQRAVADLCARDPRLPVIIRSLTAPLHAGLLADLAAAGFLLLPSRQVWLVPRPASGEWRRHRDARHDLELAARTADDWEWVAARDFTPHDYATAWRHYQRLYRQRYPRFNPDYTEHFLPTAVATGFMEVVGLRRRGRDTLSGFAGMVQRDGVSYTPAFGYDVDAPASDALYRRLTLHTFQVCVARDHLFHLSGGAGRFKFSRGAEPHVEFAAVWANHLPAYRRAQLRFVSSAMRRWAVPYLESHRL